MKIRIGSRGSQLALWQTHDVAKKLNQSGIETEIVIINTKGDKILDKPLAKIGDKGLFTKELEDSLLTGEIDLAVHSAKDLPATFSNNLELIAFTKRLAPHDVLITLSGKDKKLDFNQPLRLGTSSIRRIAQMNYYYPHFSCKPIRGNVDTRIKKLQNQDLNALIMAYAGIKRLNYENLIAYTLPTSFFITAVGQGAIAVQVSSGLSQEKKDLIRQIVNHKETELALRAEREFLKKLGGGCSVPIFALAKVEDYKLSIEGGVADVKGNIYFQLRADIDLRVYQPEFAGEKLAKQIIDLGGAEVLKITKIRNS